MVKHSTAVEIGLVIQPMEHVIRVECANGQALPYVGMAEADIGLPGCVSQPCLLLVASDGSQTQATPLILGTNVLEHLLPSGNSKVNPALKLVSECIAKRKSRLEENKGSLATLVCAESEPVRVPTGSTVSVSVRFSEVIDFPTAHVVVEKSQSSNVDPGLDITPSLHLMSNRLPFDIMVSNYSNEVKHVHTGAIVAQVTPVVLTDITPEPSEHTEWKLPDCSTAEEEYREGLKSLVYSFRDIFSQSDADLGCYTGVEHRIEMSDERPFKQRYRRIPPHMFEEVADHLKQLEANGIIRPSCSPYSSPIVCARKKDGRLRMCVDFRWLNNRTKKDNYCLPRVEEILDSLNGAKYFSKLDLKSGYHQIPIAEEHKERTAFTVGPLGFWEHNRLAFGLCNSPATFQRVMEHCFSDMNLKIMFIYIDDIIVFSNSYSEHVERLNLVFQRLRECGLKLAAQKCELFRTSISFLGFVVSERGIETDPEKIEKVKNWKVPSNAKELHSFLGFAGYYRKFVDHFSTIAHPLNALLPPSRPKGGGNKSAAKPVKPWQWGAEEQHAFDTLREKLCTAPVLAYAVLGPGAGSMEVHCDASGHGLGAVLYQFSAEGQLRPVQYASRSLSKSERLYPAHKREFLALKWCITEKFHDLLISADFVVKTDSNPLTYVLTSAKLDATGQRWLAALASFNFEIKYVPGASNTDADALSRLPDDTHREVIDIKSVEQIVNMIHVPFTSFMDVQDSQAEEFAGTPFPSISLVEMRRSQEADAILSPWMTALRQGKQPRVARTSGHGTMHGIMRRNWAKLSLHRGVMYREREGVRQLVLPGKYVPMVCHALHDDCGHTGYDKTLALIQQRYFWPRMTVDVVQHVSNCGRCIRFKSRPGVAPLVGITTTQPMELVCTDYLKVDESQGGVRNILVITDHFTRFARAIPTRNQSAKTTAEALLTFFQSFGTPKRLHSDQGANFTGHVIAELCTLMGISKSRTTPFHPMGNGSCERFNATVIRMLGTLPEAKKANWPKHIGMLVLAYNSTPHESTGFAPYELMFGRRPLLPVDCVLPPCEPVTSEGREVKQALEHAWEVAGKRIEGAKAKQKSQYDRRVKGATLKVGDTVLLKSTVHTGPHKLADKWLPDLFLVVGQKGELPVFEVEDPSGARRVVHRNLLLPVASIREEEVPQPTQVQKVDDDALGDASKAVPEPVSAPDISGVDDDVDSESESEVEYLSDSDEEVDVARTGATDLAPSTSSDTDSEESDVPATPSPRRSARASRPPNRFSPEAMSIIQVLSLCIRFLCSRSSGGCVSA